MRYYADLHVHSKYSRATSADCDLLHLSAWARRKGITVIGTGDFTHPAWMAELRGNLIPAEPGLYRLRDEIEKAVTSQIEPSCRGATRFLLSVEISTIYKKGDRTRKIHHLIYAPDFEAADRLVKTLSRIGNLNADGRPILGLDSRHLLEAVLESGEGSYLVPAHIWTPWFSVLGSKAGFDAVEDCYGDLAPHIFALETGLSSDPMMNWRISALDRYRLVSNSDAHSPPKLGREASVFDTPLDYFALRRALETGEGFSGTIEFFPEEGKYHLDGHRKCGVRLSPSETRARGEACPVCGQALTVGVLSRVEDLADREEGARPEGAIDYHNLVPLPEVLAELHGAGASSKAVQRSYDGLLSRLGPELFILKEATVETIARVGPPLLAEAVTRMRQGQVIRDAGYDGEYGTIRLFHADELRRRSVVALLFDDPPAAPPRESDQRPAQVDVRAAPAGADASSLPSPRDEPSTVPYRGSAILSLLDPDQRAAAELTTSALLIIAGPGTGKTRTLTHRIAHLVADRGVMPEQCLAITFTRRAAEEMRDRLRALLGSSAERVPTMTFHALGLSILRGHYGEAPAEEQVGGPRVNAREFSVAGEQERKALLAEALGVPARKAESFLAAIARFKRAGVDRRGAHLLSSGTLEPGSELDRAWDIYGRELDARALWDFDDLVGRAVDLLATQKEALDAVHLRYRYISIDEYQDIDERQYRLVKLLVPNGGNICAIGDPDQAIYGFRGADVGFFLRFRDDFPEAHTVRITRNYRSARSIIDAALQVIAPSPTIGERTVLPLVPGANRVAIHEAKTERAEAEFVVHTIERMMGGASFFAMDSGKVAPVGGRTDYAFSDFAILYRTEAQAGALSEALARSGMPFQKRSHRRLEEHTAVEALARALCETPSSWQLPARLKDAAARLREDVARAPAGEAPETEAAVAANADGSVPVAFGEGDVDAAFELLLPLASRADHDLGRFLRELSTSAEVDAWDPRADRISLLTLHAAKGLEFRAVFLTGCEDGLLPLRFSADLDTASMEERRLFYVGMTRARDQLFLTHACERARHGKIMRTTVSPFVHDIDDKLLQRQEPEQQRKAPATTSRQLKLF